MTVPIADERATPFVYFHQVLATDTVDDLNQWSGAKISGDVPAQFAADDNGDIIGWDGISYQIPVTVGVYLVIITEGYTVQQMPQAEFENKYRPLGP